MLIRYEITTAMLSRSILLAAGFILGMITGFADGTPWLRQAARNIEIAAMVVVSVAGIIVLLSAALVWWQTRNLDEHGERR